MYAGRRRRGGMYAGGACRKLLGASSGGRRRRGGSFLGKLFPPLSLLGLGRRKGGKKGLNPGLRAYLEKKYGKKVK